MRTRLQGCFLAVAVLLASCTGQGGALPGTPGANQNVGGSSNPRPVRHFRSTLATVDVSIVIPTQHPGRPRPTRKHFVSPATQSVSIFMSSTAPGGLPHYRFNMDLTAATNPDCTNTYQLTCSLTLSVQPGTYTASFTTYDSLLSNGVPTGNKLSANQSVPVTAQLANPTELTFSLNGIPANVIFQAPYTWQGSPGNNWTASKCGISSPNSDNVTVFAVDADGNPIFGDGAPTITLASLHPAVLAISQVDANTFSVSHSISKSPGRSSVLVAKATPLAGSGGATRKITENVSIGGGTAICGVLTTFPTGIASYANMYDITHGPDATLWFTENERPAVGKVTTNGVVTEYSTGVMGNPNYIVTGPDGKMWFSQYNSGIASITMQGAVQQYPINPSSPGGMVVGPDNNVWFTNVTRIGEITTTGTITQYFPSVPGFDSPRIAVGPDHNIWFSTANDPENVIAVVSRHGVLLHSYNDGAYGPANVSALMAGPDGRMWYVAQNQVAAMTTGGAVTAYGPAIAYAGTVGPDGNLWFTTCTGGLETVTPGGVVTPYTPGFERDASMPGITTGADGALWIVDSTNNVIYRIQ